MTGVQFETTETSAEEEGMASALPPPPAFFKPAAAAVDISKLQLGLERQNILAHRRGSSLKKYLWANADCVGTSFDPFVSSVPSPDQSLLQ
mmetsp:Transcript_1773/g.3716  ORF Transcript_1773/g.3716 Transcript_1773/m.3716 type:complete len:91 (-) Transcript_1773:889-1161(-)